MRAIGICDKAQLVDAGDECAEKAHVKKGDKERRALGRGEADQGVDAPEDGDHADDEEDQDVWRGEHVGFEVAIDEVGLREWWVISLVDGYAQLLCAREMRLTYHDTNDRNEERDLHHPVEDEEDTANHLDGSLLGTEFKEDSISGMRPS